LITLELDKPITKEWVAELRDRLAQGLSPDSFNAMAALPLFHLVIGRNHLEATKLLIEYGVTFRPDMYGRWPSTIAAICEVSEELCDLVVEAEAAWLDKLEAAHTRFETQNPHLGAIARDIYDKVVVRVIRNVVADLVEAEVVFVGPGARAALDKTPKHTIQQSDRIVFQGSSDSRVKIDGEDLVTINASAILNILDRDANSSKAV
jgi:co-chaperonin GroES (HSP10)